MLSSLQVADELPLALQNRSGRRRRRRRRIRATDRIARAVETRDEIAAQAVVHPTDRRCSGRGPSRNVFRRCRTGKRRRNRPAS